jgi:hypothetical protein
MSREIQELRAEIDSLNLELAGFRWRAHEHLGELDVCSRAVRIWPFGAAPRPYQDLSPFGGDEDWVILIPSGMVLSFQFIENSFRCQYYGIETMIDGLTVCDNSVHRLEDGSVIVITCHA